MNSLMIYNEKCLFSILVYDSLKILVKIIYEGKSKRIFKKEFIVNLSY